mmetsp:Transcript_17056/g.25639  ORF Transcript_17056/g.25639 Transcript_17056/m.25639 type:complete len:81 (-) Transcript_17056:128-370(-)
MHHALQMKLEESRVMCMAMQEEMKRINRIRLHLHHLHLFHQLIFYMNIQSSFLLLSSLIVNLYCSFYLLLYKFNTYSSLS